MYLKFGGVSPTVPLINLEFSHTVCFICILWFSQ